MISNRLLITFSIIFYVLMGCSEDDSQTTNSVAFRIKEFQYKGAGDTNFHMYSLEYDEKGRLSKIIEGTNEALFEYNEKDELVADRYYNYNYNAFGNISKIKPKLGNDSIIISYDENQLVINKIWYIENYKQYTQYQYDSQNRVIETYDYVEEEGELVFSSYRHFYEYENQDIIKSRIQIYDEESNLTWQSESLYQYEDSPSPCNLIQKALKIDTAKTFIDVTDFFPGLTIPLGDFTGPYKKYFPEHNFETIVSAPGAPVTFSETFEYEYQEFEYPSYIKRTYSDNLGRTGVSEYNWKYEEY